MSNNNIMKHFPICLLPAKLLYCTWHTTAPSTGQARRKRPIGASALDPPPPCKEQPPTATQALLSVSVCFTPLLGHTDSRTADYLFINTHPPQASSPCHGLPSRHQPIVSFGSSRLTERTNQSRDAVLYWPLIGRAGWESAAGDRCTHGPCPASAHPFICLHDKPGPLSLGRKLEDKHC